MLTKNDAKTQIARLAHFAGRPETPGGWADATDALMRYCRDLAHCDRAITAYVDDPRLDLGGNPKFPTANDIRLLAESTAPPKHVYAGECSTCGGTGFTAAPSRRIDGEEYYFVQRCGCRMQAAS